MDYRILDRIKAPEEWVESVMEFEKKEKTAVRLSKDGKKKRRMRTAVAVIACVLVCGAGVTAAAASSDVFRSFLEGLFGRQNVSEVRLDGTDGPKSADETAAGKETASDSGSAKTGEAADSDAAVPDIRAGSDGLISLEEDTFLTGEKESFVSVCHEEGDDWIVDRVYTVAGDGLKELPVRHLDGTFEGASYSFDYVTQGQEIYGFNQQGAVSEVFHHLDQDTVCVVFEEIRGDTVEKGCIAALDLGTGEARRLSDDNMICNFLMSPDGGKILCNHRSDGCWSVFDVETGTERRTDAISGYARPDEIEFLDDDHILTLGEPYYKDNTEYYTTYRVDLSTGEVEEVYDGSGEIGLQWSYRMDGHTLTVYGITDDSSFSIENVNEEYIHPEVVRGPYALFGDLEESDEIFYLMNMEDQTWMKLDLPAGLGDNIEIHLAGEQKKMLLMDAGNAKAYIVDISSL